MQIEVFRTEAPHIPSEIEAELLAMEPSVFMRWDPRNFISGGTPEKPVWEGRWEIWCELRDVSHPGAKNQRQETDRWNTEHQCFMRKLQVYKTEDDQYAPVDRALIKGLEMADTWGNRRWYEDNIEDPYDEIEREKELAGQEAIASGSSYYKNYNNPIVGPSTKGSWRWRDR